MSLRMESSRAGMTPSDLYPMSSRTSSLSTFTTVPCTIWPSSTSTRVPSIASANDMPRSSAVTWRGVYVPSSAKVPGEESAGVGESDNRRSAFTMERSVRSTDAPTGPPPAPRKGSTELPILRSVRVVWLLGGDHQVLRRVDRRRRRPIGARLHRPHGVEAQAGVGHQGAELGGREAVRPELDRLGPTV